MLARLVAVPAVIVALAGCGQGNGQHTPNLAQLPLARGARVQVAVRRCDPGANAFCAWELLVSGSGYRSSIALLHAEHRQLKSLGWTSADADTGQQQAADSPGHRLRLTYATPDGDLRGIDLGWIKRSRTLTLALSRAMFAHTVAISVLYEEGAS